MQRVSVAWSKECKVTHAEPERLLEKDSKLIRLFREICTLGAPGHQPLSQEHVASLGAGMQTDCSARLDKTGALCQQKSIWGHFTEESSWLVPPRECVQVHSFVSFVPGIKECTQYAQCTRHPLTCPYGDLGHAVGSTCSG